MSIAGECSSPELLDSGRKEGGKGKLSSNRPGDPSWPRYAGAAVGSQHAASSSCGAAVGASPSGETDPDHKYLDLSCSRDDRLLFVRGAGPPEGEHGQHRQESGRAQGRAAQLRRPTCLISIKMTTSVSSREEAPSVSVCGVQQQDPTFRCLPQTSPRVGTGTSPRTTPSSQSPRGTGEDQAKVSPRRTDRQLLQVRAPGPCCAQRTASRTRRSPGGVLATS